MAKKTYLQLVNSVLTNLRESTVSDFSSAYGALVANFVNQAKEKVEDAWNWRCLTQSATFNSVSGKQSYVLDGTDGTITFAAGYALSERSYPARDEDGLAQVYCNTTGNVRRLREYSYENLIRELRLAVPLTNQPPYGFAYSLPNQVPTLYLARAPDAVYAIEARFVAPQGELVATTDTLIVPYRPVISYATWMAMHERGEELGTQADLFQSLAADELARAITADVETKQFKND